MDPALGLFQTQGYCIICERIATFIAYSEWLRDSYTCARCGTIPRQRALVEALELVCPNWRTSVLHESSPSMQFLAEKCSAYSQSFYFEDTPPGALRNGVRCEDLEALTFADESFDLFITQDVLEHVFDPARATQEVIRVLKKDGAFVLTAPKHKHLLKSRPRATISDGVVTHLLAPEYHGNPVGDGKALVTWDYGADFDDLLRSWGGYCVSNYVIRDRSRGIDGEYLDVFVIRKTGENRVTQ